MRKDSHQLTDENLFVLSGISPKSGRAGRLAFAFANSEVLGFNGEAL